MPGPTFVVGFYQRTVSCCGQLRAVWRSALRVQQRLGGHSVSAPSTAFYDYWPELPIGGVFNS
jgi:hypothetical protein